MRKEKLRLSLAVELEDGDVSLAIKELLLPVRLLS